MKYWIFSVFTALLAYGAGCLKSLVLASNFVFHKNLRRLGSGNALISNFRRIYGWKGAAKLLLVELALDLLPLAVGALLFKSGDHSDVGAALAGFCLVLGRAFPLTYEFRGSFAILPMILMGFFVAPSIGITLLLACGLILWFGRYFSLSALGGAALLMITVLLMVDDVLTVRMSLFTAGLVLLRCLPSLVRILRKSEPRLSFERDINYKFDEKF